MVKSIACTIPVIATLLAAGNARAGEGAEEDAAAGAPGPPVAVVTAGSEPDKTALVPMLHHAPRSAAHVGEDLAIGAVLDRPDLVRRAVLVYRGANGAGEVEFQRSTDKGLPYVAIIPRSVVATPQVGYAIELDTVEGKRVAVFATRDAPHEVTVLDSPAEVREARLLKALDGRRSVIETSGEYVDFGNTTGTAPVIAANGSVVGSTPRREHDQYYRVEGSFTYRMLGVISEFGLRGGVIRGHSLVPNADPSKYDVGANYGAPRLRLRAQDWLHFEGELVTSVTEVGFSSGAAGAVHIGDPYGSKLVAGFEAISVLGARGYTRLDVVANRRLTVAPIVEVTGMPHAERAGVRLLADAHLALGRGFRVDARGGYQARSFDQGGPTLGAGASYAF